MRIQQRIGTVWKLCEASTYLWGENQYGSGEGKQAYGPYTIFKQFRIGTTSIGNWVDFPTSWNRRGQDPCTRFTEERQTKVNPIRRNTDF